MKSTGNSIRMAIALIALLLTSLHIDAQNVNQEIRPDIPPSPQAVAFNRLGDYQVSNNYGSPDISIPLFEIDHHGYKIPLSLHYEATPIKSGYNYDVTGIGWTLSGNSCVSRTIKDRADEIGRFSNPFELDSFTDWNGEMRLYKSYANELDKLNFQYDSYNIVLPSGRSIPFFMYKYGGVMQYRLLDLDSHVRIKCNYGTNVINSFTVTDENGVIYHFTDADKATNILGDDVNADRNVTWLLTSIEIPSKGTITYEYTDLITINTSIVDEPTVRVSRLVSEMNEDTQERRLRVIKIPQSQSPRYEMRFLKRIIYGPTQVAFNYYPDNQHMKEIVVSDYGQTIRKFTLNMNISNSTYGSFLNSVVISGQNNKDKLVYTINHNSSHPGNYTDFWGNRCEPGPSLTASNGQTINNYGLDDLGNFNMFFGYDGVGLGWNELQRQLSQDGMLAQLIPNKDEDHSYYWKLKLQTTTEGDTRIPASPDKHGVLNSIIYPNGGSTHFEWENHRFPTATAADGDFVFDRHKQRIIEGGGFRIKSITNYTADGKVASEDHYRYGFPLGDVIRRNFPLPLPDCIDLNNLSEKDTINNHIGCGEAVVDPNLLTFMTYSHATPISTYLEFQKMLVGLPSNFKNISNVSGSPSWWDAVFSTNTFRSLLGGRRPVVYPEITVYHGDPTIPSACMSKTVYEYDIYNYQHSHGPYYLSSFEQTPQPDTTYFEPLYFYGSGMGCMEEPAKRHQLKFKSDYSYNPASHSWNLVTEERYTYSEDYKSEKGFVFNSTVSRGHCGHHTFEPRSATLNSFYLDKYQKFGRATMIEKYTTVLRPGGTRSEENTLWESYGYKYSGVLSNKSYTDVCDKEDSYSFVRESSSSDSSIAEMISRNMLASLTSAETYYSSEWSSAISGTEIDYAFFGDNILPSKLYERNGDVYEESTEILSYGAYANPTEIVDLKTGIHSVYVWDSDGRYLVAFINNATLSQIGNVSSLLTGTSQTRHATLKAMLPNAQVQTWDYLPLIGVSSFTDVNGQTIRYEYDGLGRLISEKRIVNGVTEPEILHENEYNYLNQQP